MSNAEVLLNAESEMPIAEVVNKFGNEIIPLSTFRLPH